jgi:hypothetical protein
MCSADGVVELKGGRLHHYTHRNYGDVFSDESSRLKLRTGLFRSAPRKNEETLYRVDGYWQPTFGKRTSQAVAHQPTLIGVLRPEPKRTPPPFKLVPPYGIVAE